MDGSEGNCPNEKLCFSSGGGWLVVDASPHSCLVNRNISAAAVALLLRRLPSIWVVASRPSCRQVYHMLLLLANDTRESCHRHSSTHRDVVDGMDYWPTHRPASWTDNNVDDSNCKLFPIT